LNACSCLIVTVAIVIAATQVTLGQSSSGTIGSDAEADQLETSARRNGDALIPTCRFERARCGYIDRDGHTVIAPQFDWVDRFVGDRAVVGSAGKYGAIDTTGRFVVAPSYDAMSQFDHGLALVLVRDRLGIVDQVGRQVVPAEHGLIVRISRDAFLVAEPPYPEAGRQPGPLGDRLGRSLPSAPGRRWGIVARGGAWIMRPTFAQVQALSDDLDGLF